MRQLFLMLLLPVFILSCGTKQQKVIKPVETVLKDSVKAIPTAEENMWKMVSYSGQLGDSRNAYYITNSFAIWGTYRKSDVDNTDLKVKFLIDKVSFCIKLYEYGQKIVTKGDENSYKVTVRSESGEPLQISARNVSDRIFFNESDVKNIVGLFEKGERITFAMSNDSKANPASYAFSIDHPGGLKEVLGKLGK